MGVINEAIPQSVGVGLLGDKEYLIWSQLIRAPAKSDWGNMDPIMLAKTINMEADICAAQVEVDAMELMLGKKRDTQISNPLILVIDTLERRQLAVIRLMSLNQTKHDPRTNNSTSELEGEVRATPNGLALRG